MIWKCRERSLEIGPRTLIMGVLNVTPDSFSDGGRWAGVDAAVEQALRMEAEGADIIDIGGESSRPGAQPVDETEELRRILPVLERLADRARAALSIDTTKAGVARAALAAGAHLVNDISACTADGRMPAVVAQAGAGLVIMHMQGEPRTMQIQPAYEDVVEEVRGHLAQRLHGLVGSGVDRAAICVDPGLGFGKTVEHNVRLLAGLGRLAELGRPVLVGLSRKSFLGRITGLDVAERMAPSLGGMAYAILRGAHILRVHDVKESCAVARLLDMFRREEARCGSGQA